jgi:hypothetical protein
MIFIDGSAIGSFPGRVSSIEKVRDGHLVLQSGSGVHVWPAQRSMDRRGAIHFDHGGLVVLS